MQKPGNLKQASLVSRKGCRHLPNGSCLRMMISRHYPLNNLYRGESGVSKPESAIRGLMARAEIEISGNHDYDLRVNDKAFYCNLRGGGPLGFGETYYGWPISMPTGKNYASWGMMSVSTACGATFCCRRPVPTVPGVTRSGRLSAARSLDGGYH